MLLKTMPALFEKYTLLQAWAQPVWSIVDETKNLIKDRETAIIELIKRFRRRVDTCHITKESMRKIFAELDIDNSGALDRKEISSLLLDIFGNIDRIRLAQLIKLFDPVGDGCTYEMFEKVLYDGDSNEISHQIALDEQLRRRRSFSSMISGKKKKSTVASESLSFLGMSLSMPGRRGPAISKKTPSHSATNTGDIEMQRMRKP